MTRTSWIPPVAVVASVAVPREYRKYQSTQAMAAAPSAVTATWVLVTESPSAQRFRRRRFDPHGVERAPDEHQGNHQERGREHEAQRRAPLGGQRDGELDGEESEQRRELDDGIHGDRRRVLERIADGIAHDRGVVERRAFLLQLGLDDLLGVVPSAARVGHEDGLVETEQRDRDQVADEEVRLEERERERCEKDGQEDVLLHR